MNVQQRQHAIVIGGSIGGLMAARVLSDHFARVTVIDRDGFAAARGTRKGVPQGRHTHGLLASGSAVLERFFPGFNAGLEREGAVPADIARDGYWVQEGAPIAQTPSNLQGVIASRPLLEAKVRERVRAIPNVEIREQTTVDRLVTASADLTRVTGIQVDGGMLAADLVVDTTGRGSHASHWLRDLRFPEPFEERVEISLGYATRLFRRKPQHLNGRLIAVVPPTPSGKRGGVALAQEGDLWSVTLTSFFQVSPPLDLPGFIEFAKSLQCSHIYDLVKDAEPVGDGVPARMPASVRRRYERLTRFPEGFLVLGDAICSFNPVYGQGMSVAALEAVALDEQLRSQGSAEPLAKRFFRAASRIVDIPWSIAVGNDMRMPETSGHRTPGVRFINWYVSKLHRAAHSDAECSLAFHRVANLLAAPPSLLRPGIVWRVIRGILVSPRPSNTYTRDPVPEPHCASSPLDPSKSLSERA